MFSGRRVTLSPPRSSKVYISFVITSEVSPSVRWNTSVNSKIRRGDLAVAVAAGDVAAGLGDLAVAPQILAKQVVGAAGGLQVWGHGRFRVVWVAGWGCGKLARSCPNARSAPLSIQFVLQDNDPSQVSTGRAMPLNIRDEDTNRLAERLAGQMRSTKTAAVKQALRNELERIERQARSGNVSTSCRTG